ncbi:MAG: hypothetical protein Q8Q02_16420 [Nocardioides sp.]|nr:hypothetical protein [Nocardioides sp.]
MSFSSLLLTACFLPLFPVSLVFNQLLGRLTHAALRAALVLLWPQAGVLVITRLDQAPPTWVLWWAILTSLLYALRLLAMRDVHLWVGFLATSQWSMLWLLFQDTPPHPSWIALGSSVPLALTVLLAGGLERRFGAAYTHLYGGLAALMPRFALMLTLSVLAATATPVFPQFFVLLLLLLDSPLELSLLILATALVWSWAGLRLLQGLLVGTEDRARPISDLRRMFAGAYALTLIALAVGGIYLSGGIQ